MGICKSFSKKNQEFLVYSPIPKDSCDHKMGEANPINSEALDTLRSLLKQIRRADKLELDLSTNSLFNSRLERTQASATDLLSEDE